MTIDPRPEPADAVAAAVLAVPGVAGLHGGTFGEVATHLPGRRVEGVRIRDGHTEVHVVLRWGSPVLETGERIRAAVAALVGGTVDVAVQDVAGPGTTTPTGPETRPDTGPSAGV